MTPSEYRKFTVVYKAILNMSLRELPEFLVHGDAYIRERAKARVEELEWLSYGGQPFTRRQRQVHYGFDWMWLSAESGV